LIMMVQVRVNLDLLAQVRNVRDLLVLVQSC
jgi:hypothetical protein